MKIKGNLEEMKKYRHFLQKFRQDIMAKYQKFSSKCVNINWNDAVYLDVIQALNEVGEKIADTLATFTTDTNVPLLDELIKKLECYLDTISDYPL